MIVDLFAGPGGWDEGLRMIGRTDVLGIEWDESACLTAEAAGHKRLRADVAKLDPLDYIGAEGLIASPPCQAWSLAGKRGGEEDRAACHELADRMAAGDDSTDWRDWADDRSPLVCQPVRWVRELRPEWIALEEVPAVLGLWEHMARIFRAWGYNMWVGTLLAADYGVPQTRKRAILLASRTRKVHRPTPTHSRVPSMFTAGWVSMADVLGWGFDNEPSATVSAGGGASGGPEPFANHAWRKRLAATVTSEAGRVVMDRRTNSRGADGTPYPTPPVTLDRPAPTITGKNPPVWALRAGNQANAAVREATEPAPTMLFGHAHNDVRRYSSLEAAKPGEPLRASDRPEWTSDRPATTVQADPRIGRPGRKDWAGGESQFDHGSVRVTVQEVGILQSFPVDYPWDGLALADHVVRAGFPVVADHALADELVRDALERGVRFTVLGGGSEDCEVLDGVVRPISVDVVNNLTRLRFGDNAVLRYASSSANDGVPPADVRGALSTLVRVERITRQSPLLPVPGAEATGDGFAFTVVARRLGRMDELISCPPTPHPLVVHEAQTLRRVLPAATFDLTSSHVSSVAERVARHTNSRTKQYQQVGNAVPPRLAAHILAAVGAAALPDHLAAA